MIHEPPPERQKEREREKKKAEKENTTERVNLRRGGRDRESVCVPHSEPSRDAP